MLLADGPWSCLMVVALLATCISDVLYRRIPNRLMLTVLIFGLLYWEIRFGLRGLVFAFTGVAAGFFLLLGFYTMGWMGAGDVKIFAAFGAVLGAHGIAMAGLLGLIVGAALSLLYLDRHGPRWQLLAAGMALQRARRTGQTVPLAAALAVGILMVQMGISL